MNDRPAIFANVTLNAGELTPAFLVDLDDDEFSIRLAALTLGGVVYLDGTLAELAKFVLDLATVVREINARELGDDAMAVTPCS